MRKDSEMPAGVPAAAAPTLVDNGSDAGSKDRFEAAGVAFAALCRTMATLRGPGGCPWDQEQTFETLKPYLLEETYETLEVMSGDDVNAHKEELGDLLLQIVFQAELRQENDEFGADEVVQGIDDKLRRRHPHVFAAPGNADSTAGHPGPATSGETDAPGALRDWERVKAEERGQDASCLDGVPRTLPALLKALRVSEKAGAMGFDWPDAEGPKAKIDEEWQELLEYENNWHEPAHRDRVEAELGDLLFSVVNLARHLKIDPEGALNRSTSTFTRRFKHLEKALKEANQKIRTPSLALLDTLWQNAKASVG